MINVRLDYRDYWNCAVICGGVFMGGFSDVISWLDASTAGTMEARVLFRDSLIKQLKYRLKLNPKCTYIADGMVIQLFDQDGREVHRHILHNVNKMILDGIYTCDIADSIVKEFRKIVLNKYFKQTACRPLRKML